MAWVQRLMRVMILMTLVLSACTSDPNVTGGPRLVQEATLQPTDVLPVRVSTMTPIVIPVSTSELSTPLPAKTIEGEFPNFVLVTPTLPPSKTPTLTPSQSPTPTRTPPPSPIPPTAIVQVPQISFTTPIAAPGSASSGPCSSAWFFGQSLISACPLGAPLASQASYLQFQQGFMIWVQQQRSIYTFYDSARAPRWEVFQDSYTDDQPETDPSLNAQAPPYTWQPRRGFGLIWRSKSGVRDRIGWAVREWEEPYAIQVQIAMDGAIFLADPHGGIIGLQPGGRDWDRYTAP